MMKSQAFTLLKGTLADARGLALNHFETASADICLIDCKIRTKLFCSDELYAPFREIIAALAPNVILSVQDTLRADYVFLKDGTTGHGFYSIGPFRSLPYEESDYMHLKQENDLSQANLDELLALLQVIPTNIVRVEALAIARNILLTLHSCANPVVEELVLQNKASNAPKLVPLEDINARAKRVEEVYHHEAKLLGFVSEGNYNRALHEAEFFMQSNLSPRNLSNLRVSHRTYLYSANTAFRKSAQSVGVHPYYLDDISQRWARKLSLCVSHQQMNAVYLEMIEDYCRLCREYPNRKYSRNVQLITNYILFNLSDDLTPDIIAAAVNFSPNYVSRKIKEELGVPLMTYITEQRVRVAKRLLKDSPMPVREISLYVGMADWNYFTKIFKKSVGCTPSEYRKRIAEQ